MIGTNSSIDLATQRWVRRTGRRIDLRDHPWLDGPVGAPNVVSDRWVHAEARRLGGQVPPGGAGHGLLNDFADLAAPGFDPAAVRPEIREFYEATSQWRMQVWSAWSAVAYPFGWAITRVFSQRLQQLALPLNPLDTAHGMDSEVVPVHVAGSLAGTAWVRRLRSSGQMVYSGWYGIAVPPGAGQPRIRVVFPLPNGSVTVFLRPRNTGEGNLILSSPLGNFGDDGAYLIVRAPEQSRAWVRRVPIVEYFRLYTDAGKVLRTDHALQLWNIPALRLHYRLDRALPETAEPQG